MPTESYASYHGTQILLSALEPPRVRPPYPFYHPYLPFHAASKINQILQIFHQLVLHLVRKAAICSLAKNLYLTEQHAVIFVTKHPIFRGRTSTEDAIDVPVAKLNAMQL